jgi:hypothetical protein
VWGARRIEPEPRLPPPVFRPTYRPWGA